jgi:hypothetical protein
MRIPPAGKCAIALPLANYKPQVTEAVIIDECHIEIQDITTEKVHSQYEVQY